MRYCRRTQSPDVHLIVPLAPGGATDIVARQRVSGCRSGSAVHYREPAAYRQRGGREGTTGWLDELVRTVSWSRLP
jgi:tripartite-type tricarboxylate transporter receptor subunit TctC